jgi:hypothetical protein
MSMFSVLRIACSSYLCCSNPFAFRSIMRKKLGISDVSLKFVESLHNLLQHRFD